MKVTLDTNVLLSGTFWHGASFRIMKMAQNREIELILSEDIIEEYRKVLMYEEIQEKIANKNLEVQTVFDTLITFSTIVKPRRKIKIVMDDPSDNIILECAVEGAANYIITKDKHLLKLKEFEGIKIITQDAFLKEIL